jgi:hypothetical protein
MARVWQLFRNPLKINLLYQGAPATATGLSAINRWRLELRQGSSLVFAVDSLSNPGAFSLNASSAELTVDFSVLSTQPPAGAYKLRLYSYDPSTPAPLMWSDGDWTLEVRG